jgi:CheY-like chemotaxis protein
MKLYLDASGMVFVIGFDKDIVSDAILHEKQYSKSVTSRQYLEKLIQINYRIPAPTDTQSAALMTAYMSDSNTAALFDESAQSLVIERNTRNPRRIKRFINGFILEYKVDPDWEELGAETLVRILIIYFYFPQFAVLLDDRSRNPISEFLDYLLVRRVMRGGGTEPEHAEVDRILTDHGLPKDHPVGVPEEENALQRLEKELPEIFPELADHDDFVSLMEGFRDAPQRERLHAKLGHRSETPQAAVFEQAAVKQAPQVPEGPDIQVPLAGLNILWIDDRPEGNMSLIQQIERRGGRVVVAKTGAQAIQQLSSGQPVDLIISDIARGANENAGFEDLEQIRAETGYHGRFVFYSSRVTPSRRERAVSLQASITADPLEVMGLIDKTALELQPPLAAQKMAPA